MNFTKLALLASAIAATPIVANAQDAGSTIYGNDDAPIGTVESNAAGIVTVDTGAHKAPLPANLLANQEGKWTVNATQAQINSMMDAQVAEQARLAAEAQAKAEAQAAQALAAALVVGAPVITADEQALGLVDAVEGGNVIVRNDDAQLITLPENLITIAPDGQLMALANLADIMAAVEAAGG